MGLLTAFRRMSIGQTKNRKTPDVGTTRLANLSVAELQSQLASGPNGLDEAEVQRRLERYGYNELIEEQQSWALKFLSYFWGPIPWMIEVAAVLSALVRHWADFGIILALLIVNAIVGFWEEFQAGNTVAALKQKLALQAKVRRGGVWATIAARQLVPGDLIRVRIGDIIPADARLINGDPIEVDQSALTGESLPVTRQAGDGVYSGSIVKRGETDALVYGTGQNTYFGRTAHLVESTHGTSHFQRAVLKIGDFLILLALALVIVILSVAVIRGDNLVTTLQFALVLTVAAVPVAMPTVLSVTMAVGARILAAKQAVVSRLTSIEELAGIDVLCSDKTGTLTQNRLTLGEVYGVETTTSAEVIENAALASRAEDEDPIDLAVLSGAASVHAPDNYQILHFQPFDPVSKRTEATVKGGDGEVFKVTKGAPQVILALSTDGTQLGPQVDKVVNDFAARGFRSLGVARSDGDGSWRFQGVIPLFDPPREDTKTTLETARQMGMAVKMLTGDQIAIAREISQQLGLGTNIVDAASLPETDITASKPLAEAIERADGFAQVFPEHKYHIVEALEHEGHIVGMTGDGVNDAPALKRADAGIAVSGATDAARSAADIVLLTPGLSVIIDAVKESRKIFQRMQSYAIYRIAETIRVLFFMTLSILAFNFYPVTAVMIVLLALLNDGAILSIAYDRVVYSQSPERWNMRTVLSIATILGTAGVISSFGLFYLGERFFHLNRDLIQTLIYLKLSVAGHLTIFITRTRGPFWASRPAPILLGAVVGTQCLATLIAVYGLFMSPIGWGWAAVVWIYALAWFLVNDRVKLLAYRWLDSLGLLQSSRGVAAANSHHDG